MKYEYVKESTLEIKEAFLNKTLSIEEAKGLLDTKIEILNKKLENEGGITGFVKRLLDKNVSKIYSESLKEKSKSRELYHFIDFVSKNKPNSNHVKFFNRIILIKAF